MKHIMHAQIIIGLIYLYAQAARYDNGVIDQLTGAELLPGIVLIGVGWIGCWLVDVWRERRDS